MTSIGLPKPSQLGASAKDVVSIDDPITIEPVVVLDENCLAHGGEFAGIDREFFVREETFGDHRRDLAVPFVEQVDAVHRQWLLGGGVQLKRGSEDVDELNVLFEANVPHDSCQRFELGVIGGSIGEIRIIEIFVGDRRDEDQPRSGLAVVLLR